MLELNFTPFPNLSSERLIFRELTVTDAGQVFKLRSDPAAVEFLDKEPMQQQEEALALINKILEGLHQNENISWAIALKEAPSVLIGTIGFWRIIKEHHRAEIGYMLLPEHFNKGYMTEAINAVIPYAFNEIKLHSIEANINPGNRASEAILIKTGFVKEAHFRENYYYDGKFLDSVIYSLLTPKR